MNCPNCNAIVNENDTICKSCGASLSSINSPVDNNPSEAATLAPITPSVPKNNGMAIASMVLGIVSIPLICCCYIGVATGILAVIFGFLSGNKIKESNGAEKGEGMALAGIILGFSAIGLAAVLIIIGLATGETFDLREWERFQQEFN
mgnify:CR=1 FL=1